MWLFCYCQQPVFDGFVSTEEWRGVQQFSIPFEIEPSDNGPAHFKTEVFVHQVGNDLFVGGVQEYEEDEIACNIDIDSRQLYFKISISY